MKLTTLLLAALPLLALANPVALPEAEAAAEAAPVAAAEALDKRDKWCTVTEANVNCRKGAGTGYDIVRKIQPSDRFGVNCKAYGQVIYGYREWDWIPGWGCWVTAYYTNDGCENGVPWC